MQHGTRMKQFLLPVSLAAVIGVALGYWLGKANTVTGALTGQKRGHYSVGTQALGRSAAKLPAVIENSLTGMSDIHVGEFVMSALKEPDWFRRAKLVDAILADADASNIAVIGAAITERWKSGADTSREGELFQIVEGRLLGAASMKEFPAEPNGKVSWPTLNNMQGWASVDPRGAKKWIESLEPGSARSAVEQRWLKGLSEAVPAVVKDIFPGLTAGQQVPLIKGLVNGLHDEGGMAAVRTWFDSVAKPGSEHLTGSAVNEIVWRLCRGDNPANTVGEFLSAYADQPFVTAESFRAFTTEVGRRNPGECIELLAQLSKVPAISSETDALIRQTVETSTAISLNVLGEWLNTHKGHPLYDRTASQFALRTAKEDAESAQRWATTIGDEALRASTLETLGNSQP
jgi:hypothetical protein